MFTLRAIILVAFIIIFIMLITSLICLLILFSNTIFSEFSGENDEILELPGVRVNLTFKQYSGYLNASADHHFFYWFTESQVNPSKDPVILWLNGGPGCSSLSGLLTENGPFRVSDDSHNLTINAYSWNSIANVLYLESPAGVGFSHQTDTDLSTDDEKTAQQNYAALLHFFEKFPHFKNNDLYLTGESYAGVYVPMLALKILEQSNSSGINLKGIAIGNAYLNITLSSISKFYHMYYHGLIDTDTYNRLASKCCKTSCDSQTNKYVQQCDFDYSSADCLSDNYDEYIKAVVETRINPYNIYDECFFNNYREYYSTNSDALIDDQLYIDLSLYFNYSVFEQKYTNKEEYYNREIASSLCVGDTYTAYLNAHEVRDALHVPKSVTQWQKCNKKLFQSYERYVDVKKQIIELVSDYKLEKFIVYNGDLDMVCDFMGNQWFVERLGLPVVKPYRPWYYNAKNAGFMKNYNGLTYVVVRGAGHMVPIDRPAQALHIIKSLIGLLELN